MWGFFQARRSPGARLGYFRTGCHALTHSDNMAEKHRARKNWRCTLERAEKFISPQYFSDVNLYSRFVFFISTFYKIYACNIPILAAFYIKNVYSIPATILITKVLKAKEMKTCQSAKLINQPVCARKTLNKFKLKQ